MTFSIVTPSFRQPGWLRLCAASVADQQGVQAEHIIQDAGSGQELADWAASQPGLRLFAEADEGMYDAINRGLRRATGEICAYLNCDEQYLPGALAKVSAYFSAHPDVEVLFGDAILIDASGEPLGYRRAVLPGVWHTRLVHLNTLSCATFFRRSLLDRQFYFDAGWRMIADGHWVVRLLAARVKMGVLPEPLAAFTFTGENLGQSAGSHAEGLRWRREQGLRPAWAIDCWKVLLSGAHRVRKLLAGAYARRSLEIALFTPGEPGRRRVFACKNLDWRWPRHADARK